MYDPPACLWAIIIAGPAAVAALTCIALYGGAVRAGLGRRRAALLADGAAVVFGAWLTASAVIAGHGWYRTLPWFPVAVIGYLGLLLALRRIPVVARVLAAPVQCADHRAAAGADPHSDRAAAARPAYHGRVRAGAGSADAAARRRPTYGHRGTEVKGMQLEIDALKQAAARPGTDQRALVMLASQQDAATGLDLGLPHYSWATRLPRLPRLPRVRGPRGGSRRRPRTRGRGQRPVPAWLDEGRTGAMDSAISDHRRTR